MDLTTSRFSTASLQMPSVSPSARDAGPVRCVAPAAIEPWAKPAPLFHALRTTASATERRCPKCGGRAVILGVSQAEHGLLLMKACTECSYHWAEQGQVKG